MSTLEHVQIGNKGKPLLLLMQLEELPECYQMDELFEPKEIDDAIEGHGQCCHNVVNYNDGVSDEQWAMAVEDSEDETYIPGDAYRRP
ncbi:hypothetical protein F4604DRAFT_1941666 [Suillus subluteus]|nr:hypothetical protein F4604DRAFT_1941666 [Suillus subluteus]